MLLDELKEKLTPQQQMAVHLIVANDFAGKQKRTLEEIGKEVGVSRQTLHKWSQNPYFAHYQAAITDMKMDSYRSLVDARLMQLIEHGPSNNGIPSIKAIELYYKLSGRLVERSEVTQVTNEPTRKRLTDAEVSEKLAELNETLH